MVTLIAVQGATAWPQLSSTLAEYLHSTDTAAVDGALDTVYKLYEETPQSVERELPEGSGRCPADVLIPCVLTHFSHAEPALRAVAISTINLAVCYMPKALESTLDVYIQGLFASAQDSVQAVRKAVCAGLVQLTAIRPDKLEPHLGGVIEYMLASTQDPDEGVAVEACEFWSAYPDSGLEVSSLRPYLPRLIPVLLKNMVYDEYDEEVADAEAAEEEALSGNAPSRDTDADIKPHIHHHHSGGGGGLENGGGGNADEGNGEDNDDDDDDDNDEISRWNLRRCSAAGLDMLSNSFGDELLPLLLPAVQLRLSETDWRAREGAILALGAVSDGCAGGLAQHLAGIVAAVLPGLRDDRPMVRTISCWALIRYSRSLLDYSSSGDRQMLEAVVKGVCDRVGDHNRKVQEAACGSVASFVEEAGEADALPFAREILVALGLALQRYGRKTLRNAYDAVATVAERMPVVFKTEEGAGMILPPLFAKLHSLVDGDRDLLPLLECIAAVAPAAGPPQLQPFAEAVFGRCVDMADRLGAGAESGALDKAEVDDFIVGALDAVNGLVEGLGAGVESLVGRSALREVLLRCCGDASSEVRQSAFAVIGDLAGACVPHLRPSLLDIVGALMVNLEPAAISQESIHACNNAAWALGAIAVAISPEEVGQFALPALERLARIISVPAGGLPRSFVENGAIAVGRVALKRPDLLAPHAAAFMGALCSALRGARDNTEKEQACLGVCAVLRLNPQAGAAAFTALCEAVVSWRSVPTENGLQRELVQLITGYKEQLVGIGQWEVALSSMSPPAAQKLVSMLQ